LPRDGVDYAPRFRAWLSGYRTFFATVIYQPSKTFVADCHTKEKTTSKWGDLWSCQVKLQITLGCCRVSPWRCGGRPRTCAAPLLCTPDETNGIQPLPAFSGNIVLIAALMTDPLTKIERAFDMTIWHAAVPLASFEVFQCCKSFFFPSLPVNILQCPKKSRLDLMGSRP
jgi:hypothetical protein